MFLLKLVGNHIIRQSLFLLTTINEWGWKKPCYLRLTISQKGSLLVESQMTESGTLSRLNLLLIAWILNLLPHFLSSQNEKEQLILKCFLMVFFLNELNESTTEKYWQISRYLYNFKQYTLIRVLPLKMFGGKYWLNCSS